jgi:methyltransferase (TIGR00027 family)
VREDRPSFTAAWVAAMRGLGTFLPARLRLVDDRFGMRFAGRFRAVVDRRPVARGMRLTSPAWMRGRLRDFVLYMQLRTRVIDDDVTAFVGSGGRQVVLLGAGFDCRAWRMPVLADCTVFEVDHPATQEKKRRLMEREAPAGAVVFVPWDFERDPLDELPARLGLVGHDRRSPTMTILEGVLPYLTEEATEATFECVARYSAPGSPIVFTYHEPSLAEERGRNEKRMRAIVRLVGEPWRFGFDPPKLPVWLRARGFRLDRDEASAELAARLIGAGKATRRMSTVEAKRRHFALARVGE